MPFEKKMGAPIEKAIRDSDLGLNPASVGDMIRADAGIDRRAPRSLTKVVRGELRSTCSGTQYPSRCNDQLKKALKDKAISG